jgi:2-methylcitrate dehydratase PrpD
MAGETYKVADYLATSRAQELPADVVDKMKLLALDTIGCGLLGSRMPWTQRLIDTLQATEQPGPAHVWGTEHRFSAKNTAMVNGASIHGFELDDVGAGGHHGSVTMSVASALVESGVRASGKDLMTAVVTGIETAARVSQCVGRVPHVTCGFHGPGLFGTFAAVGTASSLMQLSREQSVHAIGNAAQRAASLMGTHHGGMGKRLLAGQAAYSGLFAAELAAHGFTNVDNIFECGYGSFPSAFSGARDTFDLTKLYEGFGEEWLSRGVNFKVWACRIPIHPSLEAVKKLRKEHTLAPDEIERVVVKLPQGSFRAVGFPYKPTTITSAQLNLQYCLAIMLLENDVFIDQFTDEKIGSPAVLDMIRRVDVTYDPELDAAGGGLMSNETNVNVLLRDGTELHATGNQRGTRGDPVTLDEIVAKFRKTTRDKLNEADANQIIDMCTHLDELDNVAPLFALLN